MAGYVAFDIETRPNESTETIWRRSGLDPLPPLPQDFDETAVKCGNLKDPAKIAEKVEAARESHAAAEAGTAVAHTEQLHGAVDKAALDARTGCVCAIGYLAGTGTVEIVDELDVSEPEILRSFWLGYGLNRKTGVRMVGHNIFGFDLPFLIRRSWALGVDVPAGVFDFKFRRWDETFIDTGAGFALGDFKARFIKLDELAEFLGAPRKLGNGADFHRLLHADREAAHDYLRGDLAATLESARCMGLV